SRRLPGPVEATWHPADLAQGATPPCNHFWQSTPTSYLERPRCFGLQPARLWCRQGDARSYEIPARYHSSHASTCFLRSRRGLAAPDICQGMHRFRFILLRPFELIPVLIGISIITFILVHLLPGNPAYVLLGPKATDAAVKAIEHKFGLDKPVVVQYF